MDNRRVLNEKELRKVDGGMVANLEDISGCQVRANELEPDSWDETPRIPGGNNGKIVIG